MKKNLRFRAKRERGRPKDFFGQAKKGRKVNALASAGEEGRGKLR
jgi:hypothetical protein